MKMAASDQSRKRLLKILFLHCLGGMKVMYDSLSAKRNVLSQ